MFHVYMILMPWMTASQRLYDDLRERFEAARADREPNVESRLVDADRPEQVHR